MFSSQTHAPRGPGAGAFRSSSVDANPSLPSSTNLSESDGQQNTTFPRLPLLRRTDILIFPDRWSFLSRLLRISKTQRSKSPCTVDTLTGNGWRCVPHDASSVDRCRLRYTEAAAARRLSTCREILIVSRRHGRKTDDAGVWTAVRALRELTRNSHVDTKRTDARTYANDTSHAGTCIISSDTHLFRLPSGWRARENDAT